MRKSKWLTLNQKDYIRGLIVAAGTAGLTVIGTSLNAGALPTKPQLIQAGTAAVAAGIAYLTKNLFTNSSDKMKPEVTK